MNREQRKRREHGPLLPSLLSVLSLERMGKPSPWTLPRTASGLQRTLRFLFAAFAPFAVKFITDTPFFVRVFRVFRGENYKGHEQGPLGLQRPGRGADSSP